MTPTLGVFGVISKSKNEALGPVVTKKRFPRSLDPNLGVFGVKIQKFSNPDKLYTKMKLLVPWLRKTNAEVTAPQIGDIWGHLVVLRSKFKNFQRQIGILFFIISNQDKLDFCFS